LETPSREEKISSLIAEARFRPRPDTALNGVNISSEAAGNVLRRQNVFGFDIVSSNGLMKHLKAIVFSGAVLLAGVSFRFAAAQGPGPNQSETVAKPKKKEAPAEVTDEPKIPSKFSKKDKDVPEGLPTFSSDVNTVQLEVAVLDNHGHFIPNIPRGNFRVLEDNVPQQMEK